MVVFPLMSSVAGCAVCSWVTGVCSGVTVATGAGEDGFLHADTLQFLLFRVTDFSRGVAGSGETSEAIAAGMVRESMSTGTLKMTTLVVVTLPILFIYPFFQKFIIKGILIGSIKG